MTHYNVSRSRFLPERRLWGVIFKPTQRRQDRSYRGAIVSLFAILTG